MKKSIIIAFLILLGVIAWFFSGYYSNNNYSQKEVISESKEVDNQENYNKIVVETEISNAEFINESILLQGQTKENRSIDIKSETTGNVIKKNFLRGQIINNNDLLIEISIEDRKEQLSSLNKEFERIKKEIILIKEKRDNNILKVTEQINLYQIEYNSAKELLNKGLGSESKLSLASYNLTQAKTELKDININFQSESINLESLLENTKSKIKNIKIDIDNTKILAPFDGFVQSSYIEVGNYITPGDIIATIVDLDPIKIQGYLSESDVNKVQLGTNTTVMVSNSLTKKGQITFISPVAETNTRTFEFIIEAENKDLLFKSGLTSTITIGIDSVKAHKISPSILTLKDDGTVGIKTVNNKNIVVFYPIEKIKDTIDGMWVKGLPEKVKIIISGQEYVNEGQIIEIQ